MCRSTGVGFKKDVLNKQRLRKGEVEVFAAFREL